MCTTYNTESPAHADSQQIGVTHPGDSIMNKAKTAVPLKVIGRKVLERWHKSNEKLMKSSKNKGREER